MVTIKDIARESGYSISTVSRVLNHQRDVSPDARKKIEEIVEFYHFVPNTNAKHLKQTTSKTIGILLKGTSNMLFTRILEVIQKRVASTAYTTFILYLDEDANEVEQAKILCRERKPMGILFLGGNPENFKHGFASIEIPCVLVTNKADAMNFSNLSSVSTDDIAAAECAVDELIRNGHSRIGIIGGDLHSSHTSKERYKGCLRSFEKNHLKLEIGNYYEKARFSYESAYVATKHLMERAKDITAIFAMSDVMAVGVIRALRDMEYSVPKDISVIGFDGTEYAKYYNPQIATMKQQSETLATKSVDILFHQLEHERESVHEIVPFEFVSGESIRKIN